MRSQCTAAAIAVLLVLCTIVHGASDQDISAYLADSLNYTNGVNTTYVSTAGGAYAIVSGVNDTSEFILEVDGQNISAVVNESVAKSAYVTRFRDTFAGDLDAFETLIKDFNVSRGQDETLCRLWTGLDNADNVDCNDRGTCLSACVHSPMCSDFYTGPGNDFIDSILVFSNSEKKMNSDVSLLLEQKSEFASGQGSTLPNRTVIAEIVSLSALINSSVLLSTDSGGYGFCPEIGFRTDFLQSADAKVAGMEGIMGSDSDINARVHRIVNDTETRLYSLQAAAVEESGSLLELKANASSEFNSTSGRAAELAKVVRDSNLTAMVVQLGDMERNISGATSLLKANETFMNYTVLLSEADSLIEQDKADFDSIVSIDSACSDELVAVEGKLAGSALASELAPLKQRKEALEAQLSPQLDMNNAETIRTGLLSVDAQVRELDAQSATIQQPGNPLGLPVPIEWIALGVVAIVAIGAAAFVMLRKKKTGLGAANAPAHRGATPVPQQAQTGNAGIGAAAASFMQKATGKQGTQIAHFSTRLVKKDGKFRAVIQINVRGASGVTVPDGTPVVFSIDKGSITPGTVTKAGRARASLVFDSHPGAVSIGVKAAGMTKEVAIAFK